MKRLRLNWWLILASVGGLAYPLFVYYGITTIPPTALVLVGLGLIGIRLLGLRQTDNTKTFQLAFLIAAVVLALLLFLNPLLAVKAYPIIVSLSVCTIFGLSLLFPPTLIERIARIAEPNLPPAGVIYTRNVTIIWTIFLLLNAAVSATTALWGTLDQWTLWNGFISYILMGSLFLGEMIVRRIVRR